MSVQACLSGRESHHFSQSVLLKATPAIEYFSLAIVVVVFMPLKLFHISAFIDKIKNASLTLSVQYPIKHSQLYTPLVCIHIQYTCKRWFIWKKSHKYWKKTLIKVADILDL